MSPAAIPILLYHAVADCPPDGQAAFTVTPAAFREHVRAMVAAGCEALTVRALAAALRGERPLPARPVLVTFDDGFADVVGAVEHLLDAGLAASVFLTSGWIGQRHMLGPADVQALETLGGRVEIGAHSVSHPRLDELPLASAAAEIADSKTALEDLLGAPVDSFAYPHGAYDRHVRAATIALGFNAAVAVKNALSHPVDDPHALARVTVGAATRATDLAQWLAGRGAPRAWRRERLRTRGYRSVRRLQRQLGRAV